MRMRLSTKCCVIGLVAMLLGAATGCQTIFSQGLRDASGISREQIKQLRYFLCNEVTLVRDVTEGSARVDGTHSLSIRNGRRIEYIVFREGTVGAVVKVGANWLDLKFERGRAVLRFIAPLDEAEEKDVVEYQSGSSIVIGQPTDAYRLSAIGWEYGPMLMPWGLEETGWHGTVEYGGVEYIAIQESASTCLQIDASSVETEKKTKRVVEGYDVTEAQATERQATEGTRRVRRGSSVPAAPPAVRKKQRPQPTASDD